MREKEQGRCWSFDYLIRGGSVTLAKLNLHISVKTGEFWDTEFSSESILKSKMNDKLA